MVFGGGWGSTNPVQQHGNFAIGVNYGGLAAYLRDFACDPYGLAREGIEVLRIDARALLCHGF
jgi:hypothetical protein